LEVQAVPEQIEKLLAVAQEQTASDLHLNVDRPPIIRVDGRLQKLDDRAVLDDDDIRGILDSITSQEQRDKFIEHHELDFSYDNPQVGRFRVNACVQQGSISIAFRLLMRVLSPIGTLGLPEVYGELSLKPRGLILVTGATGSGKSTSLAAMVHHINNHQQRHILTIEDPIEYVHTDNMSVVIQRNVGEDTESFAAALTHALRHDPDVIVVGEMRDLTTISTAISAAETGHLVLGTLHTIDASETIDRVVEVFPHGQQAQIRLQLSQVLVAVLSQSLVRLIGGGRVPACEIMICNPAIRNLIREGQIHQLSSTIQMGQRDGMQTLNHALASLVANDVVSFEDAVSHSSNSAQLTDSIKHVKAAMPRPVYQSAM
jgi:twitching motility protein PilT